MRSCSEHGRPLWAWWRRTSAVTRLLCQSSSNKTVVHSRPALLSVSAIHCWFPAAASDRGAPRAGRCVEGLCQGRDQDTAAGLAGVFSHVLFKPGQQDTFRRWSSSSGATTTQQQPSSSSQHRQLRCVFHRVSAVVAHTQQQQQQQWMNVACTYTRQQEVGFISTCPVTLRDPGQQPHAQRSPNAAANTNQCWLLQ